MRWQKPTDKPELIALGLKLASTVLAVAIVIELIAAFAGASHARRTIKTAISLGANDPNALQAHLTQQQEVADALKQKNMFMATPQPAPPKVTGILGDSALINGKWCKAGETHGDTKIISVDVTEAKVEWQGKEMTLTLVKFPSAAPPKAPARKPPPTAQPAPPPTEQPAEVKASEPTEERQRRPGSRRGRGRKLRAKRKPRSEE